MLPVRLLFSNDLPKEPFFLYNCTTNFLKKETRKKGKRGKNWEEKKGKCKREGGKVTKWEEDLFFFFFFFFSFCFLLFKTTKIVFWSTKMEIFYREKAYFMPGKKSGKMTLPPQKIFPVTPLAKNHVFTQWPHMWVWVCGEVCISFHLKTPYFSLLLKSCSHPMTPYFCILHNLNPWKRQQ